MEVIPKLDLELTATNVSEAAYSEWLSGSTYAAGETVYVTLNEAGTTEVTPHKIYESLTASNTGNYPPNDTTNWLDTGATNRWKMFDDYVSSSTSNADSIEVTLTPDGRCDTLSLFGLVGTEVVITCKSGGSTVSTETIDLQEAVIADWFDFYYAKVIQKSVAVISIPGLYPTLTIEIAINYVGGTAECSHCVVGLSQKLGSTNYSPKVGIIDYSTKETNDFGETYLNQRAFSKTVNVLLTLDSGKYDVVARRLEAVRSTPSVWQMNNTYSGGGTEYEALVVYGVCIDFSLLLQSFNLSECNLEIEGLI